MGTIEKADFSSTDAAALKALVSDIKIGGSKYFPKISSRGTALNCSSIDFGTATSLKDCACGEITGLAKSIIDQVRELNHGAETEIATAKIEGHTYRIFCKRGSDKIVPIESRCGEGEEEEGRSA